MPANICAYEPKLKYTQIFQGSLSCLALQSGNFKYIKLFPLLATFAHKKRKKRQSAVADVLLNYV